MADEPFKTSPSGLRLKQSQEIREKIRSLTETIKKGVPASAAEKQEAEPVPVPAEEPPKP